MIKISITFFEMQDGIYSMIVKLTYTTQWFENVCNNLTFTEHLNIYVYLSVSFFHYIRISSLFVSIRCQVQIFFIGDS